MNDQEKPKLVQKEEETLRFWKENNIFEKSLAKAAPKGDFVFYDGPPFATGTPHYGHILGSTAKDVIGRQKTMEGFRVPRRWGWDCHGLPIENIVEKDLKISGRKAIEEYGIEKFTEYARSKVLTYVNEWKRTVDRMGRWVDFDNSYKTMDNTFIESVWWALSELNKKGLLYEGVRTLAYCPRCETPIANSEIAMDNSYKEITDLSLTVKFELQDEPNTFALAWTTTPWTLPGNVALAVDPQTSYVTIEDGSGARYIVAEALVEKVFKGEGKRGAMVLGAELVGKRYKPLFSYYADNKRLKHHENGWKIYGADFVTTVDGTGIVHIAAAFGEDDKKLGDKENLPFVQHVDPTGHFKPEVVDFAGLSVKPKEDHQSGDVAIIKYLAPRNLIFAKEKYTHSYPHCYRCETPLYYYALPSWFINIQKVKSAILAHAEEMKWIPSHLKEGRFKGGLESAPDWTISRNRYWASPLPIWKCEKCAKVEVIGSLSELRERSGGREPKNAKGELDLHRPYIDKITFSCACGATMKRILEVIDCWFESGSMPFAQDHYPFERPNWQKENFPAGFVAEYIAQTRTWFYYTHALSTVLFGQAPFRHVVTTGNVLAEDGQKMSKSKGNFPDPWIIFDKYGVDALRLYLMSGPLTKGEDMNFYEKGVEEVYKKTLQRLDNCVSFYELSTHAHSVDAKRLQSEHVLDLWVIALLEKLTHEVTEAMEAYELDSASRPFAQFVDDLSTWYVRRSRDRAKSDDVADKNAFLVTLRHVLVQLSKLMAPFTPFFAEDIYKRAGGELESVHLEMWPLLRTESSAGQAPILEEMANVRKIVSQALELRAKNNIKVRQPLSRLILNTQYSILNTDLLPLIKDEVNVKEVAFDESLAEEVLLDTTLTPELKEEGMLRDLMRAVQEMRKDAGLQPSDKIVLTFGAAVKDFIEKNKAALMKAVGATDIAYGQGDKEIKLEDHTVSVSLKKHE